MATPKNAGRELLLDLNVLSGDECTRVLQSIHALRSHWVQRHPTLPFYTLGAASYMDAAENKAGYYRKAAEGNLALREHFSWLHERVAAVLSRQLEAEVRYREACALPGFHIFLGHPGFVQAMASVHRDLQYQLLEWAAAEAPDFSQSLSFTLPVALPAQGGGINLWDLHHEEMEGLSQAEVVQLIRSRNRFFHPYDNGTMFVASGHRVHQIAHRSTMGPEDQRVTLQGHGVFVGGAWQLYW